jgi:hypothetical protein
MLEDAGLVERVAIEQKAGRAGLLSGAIVKRTSRICAT